ncbi:unnamed protein product, partial [Didymodactylos carnosus]
HKPEDPIERERIEKAGYKVTLDGRVSGGLNLSRAIGDHGYKRTPNLPAAEQAITAYPEIKTLTIEEKDEFMIIACDGIWNFMSSQDVVDFVRNRLSKSSLTQICDDLFMYCLAPNTSGDGTGCDNMTCIIVTFKPHHIRAVDTSSFSSSAHELSPTLTDPQEKSPWQSMFNHPTTSEINSTTKRSLSPDFVTSTENGTKKQKLFEKMTTSTNGTLNSNNEADRTATSTSPKQTSFSFTLDNGGK